MICQETGDDLFIIVIGLVFWLLAVICGFIALSNLPTFCTDLVTFFIFVILLGFAFTLTWLGEELIIPSIKEIMDRRSK